MNTIRPIYRVALFLGCLILSPGFFGNTAHADDDTEDSRHSKEFVVRCDEGKTVQHYLDHYRRPGPLHLHLVGTCPGFTIARDDVVIDARDDDACPGATIDGGIFLNVANRIEVNCIAVTGTEVGSGIGMYGGNATFENVHIFGNADIGLGLGGGAYAEVLSSYISGNGEGLSIERSKASFDDTHITGNLLMGVTVEHSSSLEFMDGSVSDNDGRGILVQAGSSLVLSNSVVSNNRGTGIRVGLGSNASIEEVQSVYNTLTGLAIAENSFVDLMGGVIDQNGRNGIYLGRDSMTRIRNGTQITNNGRYGISMTMDSGADLQSGTTVPDNGWGIAVYCEDKESSVRYDFTSAIGNIDCPDADF